MFVDLDWPLNASSLLSASAELLVALYGEVLYKLTLAHPLFLRHTGRPHVSFCVSRCHSSPCRDSRFANRDIPTVAAGWYGKTDLFTFGMLICKMEFFNEKGQKGQKVYLVVDNGWRGYFWLSEVGKWCMVCESRVSGVIFQPFLLIHLHAASATAAANSRHYTVQCVNSW